MLVPCKTCESKIAKTALSCPHCGAHDPNNVLLRGVLTVIGGVIFFILFAKYGP